MATNPNEVLMLLRAMRGEKNPEASMLGPQANERGQLVGPQKVPGQRHAHPDSFQRDVMYSDPGHMASLNKPSRPRPMPIDGTIQPKKAPMQAPKPDIETISTPDGFRNYMATLPQDERQFLLDHLRQAPDDQTAKVMLADYVNNGWL